MKKNTVETWVVFQMTMLKKPLPTLATCTQSKWDEMERSEPGYHTLVYSGIKTEMEAERLARGTAGDPVRKEARNEPRT